MKTLLLIAALSSGASHAAAVTTNFDSDSSGQAPSGWTCGATVRGLPKWTIEYKDAPIAPNKWHTLRVDFKGTAIRVSLDGKTYIDTQDNHIAGPGKAGVWTKADSATLFDDFSY